MTTSTIEPKGAYKGWTIERIKPWWHADRPGHAMTAGTKRDLIAMIDRRAPDPA